MSDPVRVPSRPAQPKRQERPKYRLPANAIPPEELAVLDRDDPVDPDAAIAWLEGRGPDPWQRGGSG